MLDVKTPSSLNTATNHNNVLAQIRSYLQPKKRYKSKTVEKINVKFLSDARRHLYKERLSQKIGERLISPKDDPMA